MADPPAPEAEIRRLVEPLVRDEACKPRNDVARPEGGACEEVTPRVMSTAEQPVGDQYAEEGDEHGAEQQQEALITTHVNRERAAGGDHGRSDNQHTLRDSGEQVLRGDGSRVHVGEGFVRLVDRQGEQESCLGNAYAVTCRLVARTYTAGEAARALGISLDTLRRWDRQGRIRVQRDAANRRVVTAREVERMRGEDRRTLSARNRLEGVVREVKIEGLLAEVELDVTKGGRLVAVITRESAESLGLTRGMSAAAVVKATSVMVER